MKRIVLSLFIIILIIFLNNCQRDRSKIPVFPDTGDEDTRFNVDTLTFKMDGVPKDFSKYTMGAYFSSISSTVLAGSTAPEDADELSVWFDGLSKGTFNYMSSCLKYKHNNEERVSFNDCSDICCRNCLAYDGYAYFDKMILRIVHYPQLILYYDIDITQLIYISHCNVRLVRHV